MKSPATYSRPALLRTDQILDKPAIEGYVKMVNDSGGTYHRLQITDSLVMMGDYDMPHYVCYYHLPEDLRGQKVLDVGTAAGYLALECARRGGSVTAIDIWTSVPAAEIARSAQLDFRYVQKSVYDLTADFGQFDLVLCGSLLLHLPDQFGAIQKLRQVCRGQLSISTACLPESATSDRPLCEFVAIKGVDGDYYTYWQLGRESLRRMILTAGFKRVDHIEHFSLDSEPGRTPFSTPHVAMCGFV